MALSPRYRSKDAELLFSNAYALTVTTATYSSEIDLGGADMGAGSPVDVVLTFFAYWFGFLNFFFRLCFRGFLSTVPVIIILNI